jgi:hypothetical protein
LDGFVDDREVNALRESLMISVLLIDIDSAYEIASLMAVISAVKMLASLGSLKSLFIVSEQNAQPIPCMIFDASV